MQIIMESLAAITIIAVLSLFYLYKKSSPLLNERKIISYWSRGIFRSDMFGNYDTAYCFVNNTLPSGYRFSEDERSILYSEYETVLRNVQDEFFDEEHNPSKKFLKDNKLYLAAQIYYYYTGLFYNASDSKVETYIRYDGDFIKEYTSGYKSNLRKYLLTKKGIVALKMRYATSLYLESEGILDGSDVSSDIKEALDNGYMSYCQPYLP